jgi:hypothetical protein
MAKIRDILVHVSITTAIRERKCHRTKKHRIQPGEVHLLVRESQSLGSKNYCKECAPEILRLAGGKLAILIKTFD